jgi:ribosomal protein S12 methylthiotransferase
MNAPITAAAAVPKVGFVSLGCPKALTDSELILTQLSAEGYQTSKTFEGADLVIVNTCGFIDDAVRESLDTIGEALAENGKVIVTGCLGAKEGEGGGNLVRQMHPSVLAVTGPHATQEVMDAVHANLPKPHDPFVDLVPNAFGIAGIKLTPRHYAYLKISEGCNHRCTFCIIPSMRGDLVSRPIGDVLKEAQALFDGGVKELLVISQDTSAYGVDVKYRTGFWNGKPIKTRLFELAQALGEMAQAHGAWVRLHYVYPYPSVDDILPLMVSGLILPYLDVPFQHSHPDVLKRMKRPASGEKNMERLLRWREACPDIVVRSTFIAGFPVKPKPSSNTCWTLCVRRRLIGPVALPTARWPAPLPTTSVACCRRKSVKSAAPVSWRWPKPCLPPNCKSGWAPPCRFWWTRHRAWAKRVVWAGRTPMPLKLMVW